jgi:hypothetical protein
MHRGFHPRRGYDQRPTPNPPQDKITRLRQVPSACPRTIWLSDQASGDSLGLGLRSGRLRSTGSFKERHTRFLEVVN